ncbi:MAG: hypothetical protein ACI9T9_000657 [Oleiphilaceae bacterium]|jgi:hypothetical protein
MSWLIRGIIISIILLGIGALLLFPEMTFNKVVAPILNSVIQKTDEQDGKALKPQPILRDPFVKPAFVVTTNTDDSNTQSESKRSEQTASLQPPPNSLSGSDVHVFSVVDEINPKFKQWITPAEQIRKWVAFIDRIAQGKMATKYRPLIFKVSAFKAINKGGHLYPDPENYKRFNTLIEVVTSVRPDLLAGYYSYWLPIFDEAYAELGNDASFSKRVNLAIDNILAVNPLAIELAELKKPTSIIYKYSDTEIENNSDITKWVWRIGPENAKKLQHYLREFIRQLDS